MQVSKRERKPGAGRKGGKEEGGREDRVVAGLVFNIARIVIGTSAVSLTDG